MSTLANISRMAGKAAKRVTTSPLTNGDERNSRIRSSMCSPGRRCRPDWLTPSGERAAAAIGGIIHNKKRVLESGIVFNQGVVPNLPPDAAVEVPVMTDAAGIHPISLGPLPDPIAKLLNTQVSVQQLAVEAAVHASKEIALQALLIDPVVNSASAAVKLLDELWDVNRCYIRPCV